MAISEAYSGTETVSTTEWSLTSDSSSLGAITTDGVYQCFLELNNLTSTSPDIYEYKVYDKVIAGATQRLIYVTTFSGLQGEPIWVSPSLILLHGWEMTLKKVSGTDRAISWSIRSIA